MNIFFKYVFFLSHTRTSHIGNSAIGQSNYRCVPLAPDRTKQYMPSPKLFHRIIDLNLQFSEKSESFWHRIHSKQTCPRIIVKSLDIAREATHSESQCKKLDESLPVNASLVSSNFYFCSTRVKNIGIDFF